MRVIVFIISLFLVVLCACNGPVNHPTGGEALASTVFTIDAATDTTLKTSGGAVLKIPAGSLEADGGGPVKIEVREAYAQEDMARGRLFTHSNSQLTSDGAIYIGPAAGQSAVIRKPLSVSMPARSPQNGMMLYNGQVDDSAYVNWLDPRPLESNPATDGVDAGRTLFQTNCSMCHTLRKPLTGPALAWVTARRSRQWLFEYTRNNAKMLWRGDAYSCYLFNVYNKTPMTIFPGLTDADLESLYKYIDHASRGIDSNSIVDHKRSFDSCLANDTKCTGAAHKTATAEMDTASHVIAGAGGDGYGFTLDKFGWYNIASTDVRAGTAAHADTTIEASSATTERQPQLMQACPCWCDESAYRRADSVARAGH
jgi:mono/diheme cytochrome c family protein